MINTKLQTLLIKFFAGFVTRLIESLRPVLTPVSNGILRSTSILSQKHFPQLKFEKISEQPTFNQLRALNTGKAFG